MQSIAPCCSTAQFLQMQVTGRPRSVRGCRMVAANRLWTQMSSLNADVQVGRYSLSSSASLLIRTLSPGITSDAIACGEVTS